MSFIKYIADESHYKEVLSLVRTDDKTFYFHCAMEGEKLDCIVNSMTSRVKKWNGDEWNEQSTNHSQTSDCLS